MADSSRGRAPGGRARARARPPAQNVQGPGPASRPGPPPSASGPPPSAQAVPAARMMSGSGRATSRGASRNVEAPIAQMAQMSVGSGNGSSGGNGGGVALGRGNTRGNRQINVPTVRTKPSTVVTKQGTMGQPIIIQANYFSLVEKTDWCLYQYRVDFDPTIDLTWERKKLLRAQKNNISCEYIFDGTVMYCSRLINPDPMEVYSARESDGSQIRVTIRRVGELTLGDHHYLQFFNILTRKCLGLLNLEMINRDFYDPKSKVEVRQFCLELWPGYRTTIRQHETQVLMMAEITHKVMRTDNCLQLLRDITKTNQRGYREDYGRAITGSVVLTDYNNKTYSIADVNWNDTPASTFDRNGKKTSYIEYYKERYNITIRQHSQPLLVAKSKPRERRAIEAGAVSQAGEDSNLIFLIPELCRLTGLTDEMRGNFQLMKALAEHTRIMPAERIKRLMAMNNRLQMEQRVRKEFQDWNLKLSDRLIQLPARILKQEEIYLGANRKVNAGDRCDWTRDLRSNSMFTMPTNGLDNWAVVYPGKVENDLRSFVQSLTGAGRGMGFMIGSPFRVPLNDDRSQSYLDGLDRAINERSPQLILVILLNQKADKYTAVKKRSLVDRAVPTQVLLARNLSSKGQMSIATKVAIQLNCKIGGAPWSVNVPLNGLMVVGFDVCHDSKEKAKSFGAMVASLNKPMSRYFSAVSSHSTGEELSNDLALNITRAMQVYQKHNQALPKYIVVYRDGVGDGQIPYVYSHETKRIASAVNELSGGESKLVFIIVTKKINTRLFFNNQNPPPGTVVDDVITLPERYDFYLISQYVNQGTVSPTSYNIIYDDMHLSPDKMQVLSYKLTHMYYNWSGTVRVPAPVQYAHKLAFLVGQSLHRAPNPSLQELLYFL